MRLPRRFLALGLASSLNWRTHLIFSVPAFLSAGFFDLDRLGGSPSLWIALSALGFLVTVVAIELISALTRKRRWTRPRPFLVLAILALAGLIRGLTIYYLGLMFGLIPDDDLLYRVTGAPVFVVAVYVIADLMVSSFVEHREQLKTLEDHKARLVRIRDGFEQELRRLNEAQRARVRELVAPSIWELQKHLSPAKKNVQDAIFELKSLNEEIVRPLSQQYAEARDLAEVGSTGRTVTAGAKPTGIPASINISRALDPVLFLMITLAVSFSAQNAVLGLQGAVVLVTVVSGLAFLMFMLYRFLLRARPLRTTTAVSLTIYVGAGIGALAGLTAQWLGLTATALLPVQSSLFVALTMLLVLLVGAFQQERDGSLAELTRTLEALEVLNSRLRQRAWLSRKALAMELHGNIQGTLQSVAAKLAKIKNPSDAQLDSALTLIREAFDRVGSEDYLAGKTLKSLLDDLIVLWEGALDVQIELDLEAQEYLEQDRAAARVVLELCREATTNAAKHGQAEQVKIQIFRDQEFLVLTAFNDGVSMKQDNRGRGLELYQEVSHRFALSNVEGGVKLNLLLPISQ